MKKIKIVALISLSSIMLMSCGTVKEGFANQKKDNTDEFLVEKKAPLVMPPGFNELLVPKDDKNSGSKDSNDVKKLITKSKNKNSSDSISDMSGGSLENLILDKIKK